MSQTWMPILNYKSLAVRMSILKERQAMKNHGQTLEELANRGGLSLEEAACVAAGIMCHPMSVAQALGVLEAAQRGEYRDR